ncbi:hypothetical protein ABZS94_35210 [Streptomyces sp. NPDC005500]|uniref:hypothetical protein n=1 Tax=Streptomyces sp. NPDC005500 TaxID=3155007 RepID=UPI0033A48AF1
MSDKQRRMTTDPNPGIEPDTDVNHTLGLQVGDFDGDYHVDLMRFAGSSGPSDLFHGPFDRTGAARYITPSRGFGALEGDSLAFLTVNVTRP